MMIRSAALRGLDYSHGSPKTRQYWDRIHLITNDLQSLNCSIVTFFDAMYLIGTVDPSDSQEILRQKRDKLTDYLHCIVDKSASETPSGVGDPTIQRLIKILDEIKSTHEIDNNE
ncbi:MAG: hypothetical protein Q4D38_00145 [Planctomycetia bacterium]|nr:hypothetical protein [Planctomycetia bacterium]